MITVTDIKRKAIESLSGKWGKGALIVFCYFIVEIIFNLIQNSVKDNTSLIILFDLIDLIISVPISFGLVISFIKLKRNEEVSGFDFLKVGIDNFYKAWSIGLNQIKKMIVPIILIFGIGFISAIYIESMKNTSMVIIIVICAIMVSIYFCTQILKYVLSDFIAYDNPEMTGKEAVEKSAKLMNGNRGRYVLLMLSFMGWLILCIFTLGIGYLWLLSYIQVATVCFYEELKDRE